MANAYLGMAYTTKLPAIVRGALSAARNPTLASGYNFLGSNDTDRDAEIVRLANASVLELEDDFPLLNISTEAATTVAGQQYVALPATLRHTDVVNIHWMDGTEYDLRSIRLLSQMEVDNLPTSYLNGEVTAEYPHFASLSWLVAGTGQLLFYPTPSAAKAFYYVFRPVATPFTTADLTAPGTVTCRIPDDMIELLELYLAVRLAERCIGHEAIDVAAIEGRRDKVKARWTQKLSQSVGSRAGAVMNRAGFPRTHSEQKLWDFDVTGSF